MTLRGRDRLSNRFFNKGTAFSEDERDLHGLIPPVIEDLDTQLHRVRVEYDATATDIDRHVFLRMLQQRSTVLFYRFVIDHLAELLPIIYTPTVGLACQEWSRIYRREHGLYVSMGDLGRVDVLLDNALAQIEAVSVVVVTDGERVLGLGDLGAGGMGISIGKLALYSAVGGVDPSHTLPILLDVGTDNEALLSDPLYLGRRHRRVEREQYDALVDELVDALRTRCPGVLLQWEDFAQHNAGRLLRRHRERICSFNDDIQGTAAVTAAAVIAGMQIADVPIESLRTVIVGAGSAGMGIADQIVATLVMRGVDATTARGQIWIVDRWGLLCEGQPELVAFQQRFARPLTDSESWVTDTDGRIGLFEVVRKVEPHALIGVTGQPGLFTEEIVRAMGDSALRPIIMPLSNPTVRAEALPEDLIAWTGGRALIGTGSPFGPVEYLGVTYEIAQVNNVSVFPGLGLGIIACGATSVTADMITAASLTVADFASTHVDASVDEADVDHASRRGPTLVPPIADSRAVAHAVAFAVAGQAVREGVAPDADDGALLTAIARTSWVPEY